MAETETCGPKIAKRSSSPPVYSPGQVWEKGPQTREVIHIHKDGCVTYKSTNRKVTVGPESWRRWIHTGYLYEPGTHAVLKSPVHDPLLTEVGIRAAYAGRISPQAEWDGPARLR